MFGTERPGVGTVKDPRTGRWLDETRYIIEDFEWLSDADKKLIFEDNAKKVFKTRRRRSLSMTTFRISLYVMIAAVLAASSVARRSSPRSSSRRTSQDHHQLSQPERLAVAPVPREGRRLLREVRPRRRAELRRAPGRRRDARERPGPDGELVARTDDAGGVERRLAVARRQLAQPRHVRADGEQGDQGRRRTSRARGSPSARSATRRTGTSSRFSRRPASSDRDVQWIPVGQGVAGRAAALTTGRADATILTAPAYFKLEAEATTRWSTSPSAKTSSRRPPTWWPRRTCSPTPRLAEAHHQGARRSDQEVLRRQAGRRRGVLASTIQRQRRRTSIASTTSMPSRRPSNASRTCWRPR